MNLQVQLREIKRSLLDSLDTNGNANPFLHLRNKAVRDILKDNIDLLRETKIVLSLYYYEDLNLKEIGRILEVTESRVSQLHTQAVGYLRNRLKDVLVE